jgi:alginate O-acetyltransferase complex protein AlgI
MLFNSYIFIFIFLPLTFLGMVWLGQYRRELPVLWLGLCSLLFYSAWNPIFVLLLFCSILANYFVGKRIGVYRVTQKNFAKILLITAIISNFFLLGYFKYSNFFIETINPLFHNSIPSLDIILPLGISFFTFTQAAYLADVYKGVARENSFINYLLFVAWFPQLIAGPMIHHQQMMPQFAQEKTFRFNLENVSVGLTIFVLGLAKKLLIADNLAQYATPIFTVSAEGNSIMLFEAWIGALAYTFQLYFDFSAYSDMAIGLSLMFNVRLPLNFNSPYKAISIIDFWQRWHMSLTSYIRQYIYTPLMLFCVRMGIGRSKQADLFYTLIIPNMIVFLLLGLWHGANWTFVLFGAMNGIMLIINHLWRRRSYWKRDKSKPMALSSRLAAWLFTFIGVVFSFVMFRAESVSSAIEMFRGMLGFNGISLPVSFRDYISTFVDSVRYPFLKFDGVNTLSGVDVSSSLSIIITAFVIALIFPNIRQIMRNYKTNWQDYAGRGSSISTDIGFIAKSIIWRPSLLASILLVIVFLLCVENMSRVSEFLYFEF